MIEFAYLNGNILPIQDANVNVADLGLLRGYGVFDFFRAIDGRPIFMDDHLDRFEKSTAYLGLDTNLSRDAIKEAILILIERNRQSLLGIKLVCTGGYSDDGYTPHKRPNLIMLAKPFVFHPFDMGLKLMTVSHQRDLPTIKTTNYIKPISLLPKMKELSVDDVLYHMDGYISESSRSNIFLIKNGVLITPEAGILEGVTRKRILSFASQILPMEIRQIHFSELKEAEEVFLCGSTKRIAPITAIDDNKYAIGPWTTQLYHKLLEEELK